MHLTKRILAFMVAEALRGNTWAGDSVFDSPGDIGSIRIDRSGADEDDGGVFVAVYCDEWDNKGEMEDDWNQPATNGSFKIIIEVGAARPIVGATGEDGEAVTTLAATSEGLEWSLAFIARQCVDTILDTRPAFAWSNLFQRFIDGKLLRYSIRRGEGANSGKSPAPRYASCVSILKVSPSTGEPPRGKFVTPNSYPIWSDLLTMMEQREDLLGTARLIRAHFEPVDGKELSDLKVDAARMWVSAELMAAIGLADENSVKLNVAPDTGEAVRHDVPLDEGDMRRWLASQGPDAPQGPPNAG